ncbi:MAG: hypothetical protein IJ877_02250 [Candidatus Gastranaerophilales bacterium]|nr:hypothetical protein [Candidatus Gastranaerophilales bacterium]
MFQKNAYNYNLKPEILKTTSYINAQLNLAKKNLSEFVFKTSIENNI